MITDIHTIPGSPPRLDPGRTGLSAESFAFINVSPFNICDLTITCWDDSGDFLFAPEILPDSKDGVVITRFTPIQMPGDRVGVGNETLVPRGDWDRSNKDAESRETRVVFDADKCIPPGAGFILNLQFDETLDGNEGIEVKPSRILNGEHYGFGQDAREREAPLTWTDLLRILGDIGGSVAGLIAQNAGTPSRNVALSSRPISRLAAAHGVETQLALNTTLGPKLINTPINRIPALHLDAVPGIDPDKAALLTKIGIKTIGDLARDDDVRRLMLLIDLLRLRA